MLCKTATNTSNTIRTHMKQHSSSNNTEGTGIKCSSQNVIARPQTICNTLCTRWGELSWIKWNDGGGCDLAPPPQRRRRRRPPPPPPRNLPFVILPCHIQLLQGRGGAFMSEILRWAVCVAVTTCACNSVCVSQRISWLCELWVVASIS